MRNRSLIVRYTMIYLVSILIFVLVAGGLAYGSIARYFEEDAFESIEYGHKTDKFFGDYTPSSKRPVDPALASAARGVHHAYYFERGQDNTSNSLRAPILAPKYTAFAEEILKDRESYDFGEHYSKVVDGNTIYFILNYNEEENRDGDEIEYYSLSFMTDTHVNGLTQALFKRFIIVMIGLVFVVTIIGYFMFRTFRKKFKILDLQISRIAKRDWDVPVIVEGNDEFSRIQERLEDVREQLLFYDSEMKQQFHAVSHEFKTPIMIIRGYVDATLAGKYPKGSLEASLKVIDDEMIKLNEMVNKVLYLNKIDYLSQDKVDELSDVKEIIERRLSHYKPLREEVAWVLKGSGRLYSGSEEQWTTVINNIFDNQIRYAKEIIEIDLQETITFYNDGPLIDSQHLDKVFNTFFKGQNGQSGLGLAIVKKILMVNGYEINVENVCPGVKFKISVTNPTNRHTIK